MKALPIILAAILLAGCAGTRMQDTSGMSGTSGASAGDDLYQFQHQKPGDTYFGD
ncbi:hypothetical protein [Noviherbaspirillum sp.]|uniref:hypothetical protein n=1 Tax=Noviherbaspirillum sp. TaxID=1926288 RepID=UPI002B4AAA8E|nr:hypothetical protein [Noviherbaspirillum sp.]HJV81160.1 hypothetical protein [Noviherbaspirillum sp.]